MTTASGPIAALPSVVNMPYSLANEQRIASAAGVVPVSMSRDRTTIFGFVRNAAANGLYTINDTTGATTLLYTFSNKASAIVETYDGEALVVISGAVWRSTGWSANKATATWASVLTIPGGTPFPDYSANRWSMGTNGVMVIAEQGAQTIGTTATGDNAADNATAVTNNAARAHRCYVTADNGKTWFTLIDLLTDSPLVEARLSSGVHPHGWQYDEEWDCMWGGFGDNTGQGPNLFGTSKLQLIYSFDWRNVLTGGKATWNTIPLLPDYQSTVAAYALQVVGMLITSKNVILGPDGIPYGFMIIPRLGYRQMGAVRFGPMLPFTTGGGMIGKDITWAGSGYPVFASYAISNGTNETTGLLPHLFCSADEGSNWFEIWKDSNRARLPSEKVAAFGPTVNNKVVASTQNTNGGASANGYTITWDLVKNT